MNPFKKKLFLSLGIFLSSIVVFAVIFWILGGSIKAKVGRLSAVDKNLDEINANFSSLTMLKQQYNGKVSDYIKIIANTVPPQDNLINFLKDFQSLATASGLGFGFTFAGETPPSSESLGWISFNSNLQGSVGQFLSFLDSLPKINFLVNFGSATISRRNDSFQFDLKGRVFFK